MITKDEWQSWAASPVTKKLVEVILDGQKAAVQELIFLRGEIGDFHRGVGAAYEEVLEEIRKGENIYSKEE